MKYEEWKLMEGREHTNDLDIAWLAGLLEGEGSFWFNGSPRVKVAMTDRDIIQRAANLMGTPVHKRNGIHDRKTIWTTELGGKGAVRIMNRILHLMGRRRTAKITEIKELANNLPGQARGTRIGAAKLTEDQVRNIRSDNDYSDARLA